MPNRERIVIAGRALLVVALCALAAAAVATELGNAALSRFAGTTAWSTGIVGAVIGLIVELRHGTSS